MKQIIIGDALSHPTGLIAHGCNAEGVMNSGIAKAVKERYPVAFKSYSLAYSRGKSYPDLGGTFQRGLQLGQIIPVEVENNKWIVNAITQLSYGRGVRQVSYDAITTCFEEIVSYARQVKNLRGLTPQIIYPLIGAGLGGGNWHIIDKIIDETISNEFPQIVYGFKVDLQKWKLL